MYVPNAMRSQSDIASRPELASNAIKAAIACQACGVPEEGGAIRLQPCKHLRACGNVRLPAAANCEYTGCTETNNFEPVPSF